MFKIQTRAPNAAGTRLGPWKDLMLFDKIYYATEQEARAAAAALDQDGMIDEQFVRVVSTAS